MFSEASSVSSTVCSTSWVSELSVNSEDSSMLDSSSIAVSSFEKLSAERDKSTFGKSSNHSSEFRPALKIVSVAFSTLSFSESLIVKSTSVAISLFSISFTDSFVRFVSSEISSQTGSVFRDKSTFTFWVSNLVPSSIESKETEGTSLWVAVLSENASILSNESKIFSVHSSFKTSDIWSSEFSVVKFSSWLTLSDSNVTASDSELFSDCTSSTDSLLTSTGADSCACVAEADSSSGQTKCSTTLFNCSAATTGAGATFSGSLTCGLLISYDTFLGWYLLLDKPTNNVTIGVKKTLSIAVNVENQNLLGIV